MPTNLITDEINVYLERIKKKTHKRKMDNINKSITIKQF